MLIRRLQLQSFRRFAEAELHPQPGFNLITGDNGSGKTSLLEAVHLLAHGRSFRGRVRDGLIRREQPALSVFAEWRAGTGSSHRAGLRHTGGDWEARLDGAAIGHLGELCEALAVVTFEPAATSIGGCSTWNVPSVAATSCSTGDGMLARSSNAMHCCAYIAPMPNWMPGNTNWRRPARR